MPFDCVNGNVSSVYDRFLCAGGAYNPKHEAVESRLQGLMS